MNAEIGIIRALLPAEHEWQELLGKIQMEMMAVMSHVATPSVIRDKNPNKISEDIVLVCEEQIDALSAKMEDNGYFILPGGSLVSAHLQLARTIVRRAERRMRRNVGSRFCTNGKNNTMPEDAEKEMFTFL